MLLKRNEIHSLLKISSLTVTHLRVRNHFKHAELRDTKCEVDMHGVVREDDVTIGCVL